MKPASTIALSLAGLSLLWLFPVSSKAQSKTDKGFIMKAAQSNIAEIRAGQLAAAQGSTEMVKRFGTMMVNDHTMALNELDSIVRREIRDSLPTEPDAEHKALAQQLQGMQGKAFDDAYIQSQIKDHKAAIALFETEVAQGEHPSLKAYATKTLPKLRMHLDHVQALGAGSGQTH
jgi:putative membrane protein